MTYATIINGFLLAYIQVEIPINAIIIGSLYRYKYLWVYMGEFVIGIRIRIQSALQYGNSDCNSNLVIVKMFENVC